MDNPQNPDIPVEGLPDFLKPIPSGYIRSRINTHLTKLDHEDLQLLNEMVAIHLMQNPDDLDLVSKSCDAWVDGYLARKQARKAQKKVKERAAWKYQTPKWLRPQCGAKTRAGGKCRATPVWDKVNNRPRNGRCRMHGGLSTGPKTKEGKRRALENLRQCRNLGVSELD